MWWILESCVIRRFVVSFSAPVCPWFFWCLGTEKLMVWGTLDQCVVYEYCAGLAGNDNAYHLGIGVEEDEA